MQLAILLQSRSSGRSPARRTAISSSILVKRRCRTSYSLYQTASPTCGRRPQIASASRFRCLNSQPFTLWRTACHRHSPGVAQNQILKSSPKAKAKEEDRAPTRTRPSCRLDQRRERRRVREIGDTCTLAHGSRVLLRLRHPTRQETIFTLRRCLRRHQMLCQRRRRRRRRCPCHPRRYQIVLDVLAVRPNINLMQRRTQACTASSTTRCFGSSVSSTPDPLRDRPDHVVLSTGMPVLLFVLSFALYANFHHLAPLADAALETVLPRSVARLLH